MEEQVGSRSHAREPVDPDVESALGRPEQAPLWDLPVLLAIAAGGVLGSVARYEAGLRWRTPAGHFPWTTMWINVVGCGLIGIVIVLVSEVFTERRLARPFFGTGILGGFTTFSTYAVDSQRLFQTGHEGVAVTYLVVTLAAALLAVTVTTRLTRRWALAP